jgi:glutaredoxin-like YruB-family protein
MAVTLYSTPTCGFCTKAKAFFRERRIPFTEYNVAADQRKADEMLRKSGQMGVPVIDVNGKIIVGFNQPEIERALKR